MDILKELSDFEGGVWEIVELAEYKDMPDSDFFKLFGESELVSQVGGYEGEGDYVSRVIHFKKHSFYAKITGFYSSYEGTEWNNDWSEVKPQEKTIAVYV